MAQTAVLFNFSKVGTGRNARSRSSTPSLSTGFTASSDRRAYTEPTNSVDRTSTLDDHRGEAETVVVEDGKDQESNATAEASRTGRKSPARSAGAQRRGEAERFQSASASRDERREARRGKSDDRAPAQYLWHDQSITPRAATTRRRCLGNEPRGRHRRARRLLTPPDRKRHPAASVSTRLHRPSHRISSRFCCLDRRRTDT